MQLPQKSMEGVSEMKVGIPILALYPNGSAAAEKKGRHRGNLLKVAQEAGNERYSKDQDLDRKLSVNNTYEGINGIASGQAANDYIMGEVGSCNLRRKAQGKRAMRNDAAVGLSYIVKPPAEEIARFTPQERTRFFQDSREILDGIFGSAGKLEHVLTATHRDEPLEYLDGQVGDHEHNICIGYDKDGNISIDPFLKPQIMGALNRDYPRMMRERGWDVEDCSVYDPTKAAQLDGEELDIYKADCRKEKKARAKVHGVDSTTFKATKQAERIKSDAQRAVGDMLADAQKARAEGLGYLDKAKTAYNALLPSQGKDVQPNAENGQEDAFKAFTDANPLTLVAADGRQFKVTLSWIDDYMHNRFEQKQAQKRQAAEQAIREAEAKKAASIEAAVRAEKQSRQIRRTGVNLDASRQIGHAGVNMDARRQINNKPTFTKSNDGNTFSL